MNIKAFFSPLLILLTLSSFSCAEELVIGQGEFNLTPDTTTVYKTAETPKGTVELKIHGFLPKDYQTSDSRAAILFFHGGGWYSGTPDQFYTQCRYFALRGMVTYSAEYRLIKKHGTTPKECVTDGKSAFRWLRKNAESLGIDPNKIALGGGSAGGHIASAIALCDGFHTEGEDQNISLTPQALLLYNPVFDNGPGGFAHDLVKNYWKQISPIDNIDKDTPPSIVILGTEDTYLPVSTTERYRDALQALNIPCRLHVYQDKPHGFFNLWVSKEDLRLTTIQVDHFLTSLGLLEGETLFK